MKIIATIQARLGSTRLPKKVLRPILGKPMLLWQVERIRESMLIDEVVVATSTSPIDDEIELFCKNNNIKCFRGSENDVLDRIASLLAEYQPDIHVEFFGDSPLVDAELVDQYIGYYLKNKNQIDFLSNHQRTTYPPGSEIIIYDAKTLIEVNQMVEKDEKLREHVSIHIKNRSNLFKLKNIEAPEKYHYPDMYLEVDTIEDFQLVTKVFEYFVGNNQAHFNLLQIINFLKSNQELIESNKFIERRWKQYRDE